MPGDQRCSPKSTSEGLPHAAVAAAGCTNTDLAPTLLETGDEVVYREEVQSYVGLGCGSLDCHGDGGRALRILAKYGLRQDASLRTFEVSDSETLANVSAFAALTDGDVPDRQLALLKPLAVSSGGMAHIGGDVWASTASPGYRCLLAYLSGASDDTACAASLAEVDVEE